MRKKLKLRVTEDIRADQETVIFLEHVTGRMSDNSQMVHLERPLDWCDLQVLPTVTTLDRRKFAKGHRVICQIRAIRRERNDRKGFRWEYHAVNIKLVSPSYDHASEQEHRKQEYVARTNSDRTCLTGVLFFSKEVLSVVFIANKTRYIVPVERASLHPALWEDSLTWECNRRVWFDLICSDNNDSIDEPKGAAFVRPQFFMEL